MQELGHAGLVQSQRGLHGGFTLVKDASTLTIAEVVQAVEPIRRIRTCPLGLVSHRARLCPLHKRLDDALASIEKAFRDTTIADVLNEPTTSRPLCPFPQVAAA